jgi:pimeloyl-ACP methyl ester carboxylesterase
MASRQVQPIAFTGASGNPLSGDFIAGKGAPLLFLHGGGQTRHAWSNALVAVAAQGASAIAIDLRGHGDSAQATDGDYRFSAYAADVAAVASDLTTRFGSRPVAIGASLGGLSSLVAEQDAPGLLGALVLVDITPDMDIRGVEKIQGFMGERMSEGFASLNDAADAIARYLPHRNRPKSLDGLAKNLRRGADGRFRWHWDPRFLNGDMSINHDSETLMRRSMARLGKLDLPVLLVRGMRSELVDETRARAFCAAAPNARYVDVGDAGHMVAGDRNDVFIDEIVRFLGSIDVLERDDV